ncbi:MAG: 4Fe-4S dicluster domain-containing protein [Dysgonamonadaceae bacterium]|jgi:ferredoxin|nr:4Fe-4S dicluster domain-containing protein [Dysgonamonadaceae bacterium]
MEKLREIAGELLKSNDVKVVIGYTKGMNNKVTPFFAKKQEDIAKLICGNSCAQNLAVYLYKKDISDLGKPAIVANIHTLRGIMRLAVEKQIDKKEMIILAIDNAGDIQKLDNLSDLENYLSSVIPQLNEEDQQMLDELNRMTPGERMVFWKQEMKKCIKCYACRQACPLCYCTRCTVEENQPQWIPVASSVVGNLEWHMMRAMHLSGRCVECGQCGKVCPVNIPIHLLPVRIAQEMKTLYGTSTGISLSEKCDMSTFKPDDKENFIG